MSAKQKINKLIEEFFGFGTEPKKRKKHNSSNIKLVPIKNGYKRKDFQDLIKKIYKDEEINFEDYKDSDYNFVYLVLLHGRVVGYIELTSWDNHDLPKDCLGNNSGPGLDIVHIGMSKYSQLGTYFIDNRAEQEFLKWVSEEKNYSKIFKVVGLQKTNVLGIIFDDDAWLPKDFKTLRSYGYISSMDKEWKCEPGWAGYLELRTTAY